MATPIMTPVVWTTSTRDPEQRYATCALKVQSDLYSVVMYNPDGTVAERHTEPNLDAVYRRVQEWLDGPTELPKRKETN